MGTIALISVLDESGDKLMKIHTQHDGGTHLKSILDSLITNGRYINSLGLSTPKLGESFLGMGCFAATLVSHLKKECGNVFITNNTNDSGIYDYTYNIRYDNKNKKIIIE